VKLHWAGGFGLARSAAALPAAVTSSAGFPASSALARATASALSRAYFSIASLAARSFSRRLSRRVVALRKDISVEKGDNVLFSEYRFFFYITNDWELTAHQVVAEARSRCNQENLIAQLKGQVRALHAPVNTLVANWAYMVMAALAWSIKAWCALLLPVHQRWAR